MSNHLVVVKDEFKHTYHYVEIPTSYTEDEACKLACIAIFKNLRSDWMYFTSVVRVTTVTKTACSNFEGLMNDED